MNTNELRKITDEARRKKREVEAAKAGASQLEAKENEVTVQLREQLHALKVDQEVRQAQEQLPLLLLLAANQGKSEANVFTIGFRHTSGHVTESKHFHPERVENLVGSAKIFYEWLKEQGYEPRIKGAQEDYFDRYPASSTGFYIAIDFE